LRWRDSYNEGQRERERERGRERERESEGEGKRERDCTALHYTALVAMREEKEDERK
jgi:hypothetical protein